MSHPMVQVQTAAPIEVYAPPAFRELYRPHRYKIWRGGRGAAKSHQFAEALVIKAGTEKKRILCGREFQNSIKDSVHQLLCEKIAKLGMQDRFTITDTSIESVTGSDFLFKGLRRNLASIKSTEGVDIFWNEEAQATSKESLRTIIPTIRKPGSELWFSYNPINEDDPVHKMALDPKLDGVSFKVTYEDNPYFPEELEKERLALLESDPDAYDHVWEGECLIISDAVIFRSKVVVEAFETPTLPTPRFFHGVDWGFANDPLCIVRCYITKEKDGEHLWIDRAWFGYKIELDDIPEKFDQHVTTARKWPIKADNARPETISYVRRQGFNIEAAEKWNGSVEDGITHLKGFRKIHIHQDLKQMAQEARLYSYKVDKITQDVLPDIVDKHNHGWDAIRYALDGYIKARGGTGVWAKLAGSRPK